MRRLSAMAGEHVDAGEPDIFFVSFCDLLVLLCTFFALMLGMSKIDTGSFEKLRSRIKGNDAGTLVELSHFLSEQVRGAPGVSVSLDTDGVRINFDSAALFESGSAQLKTELLAPLAPVLNRVRRSKYLLDVEGHTDDRGFHQKRDDGFDTNWSLSGRRASSVIHYLLEMGFQEKRLRIIGYAANRPKVDPAALSGEALDQARSQNRRVSILVH